MLELKILQNLVKAFSIGTLLAFKMKSQFLTKFWAHLLSTWLGIATTTGWTWVWKTFSPLESAIAFQTLKPFWTKRRKSTVVNVRAITFLWQNSTRTRWTSLENAKWESSSKPSKLRRASRWELRGTIGSRTRLARLASKSLIRPAFEILVYFLWTASMSFKNPFVELFLLADS